MYIMSRVGLQLCVCTLNTSNVRCTSFAYTPCTIINVACIAQICVCLIFGWQFCVIIEKNIVICRSICRYCPIIASLRTEASNISVIRGKGTTEVSSELTRCISTVFHIGNNFIISTIRSQITQVILRYA